MGESRDECGKAAQSGVPPSLQPMVVTFVSLSRSAPRTDVPACCGVHICLCHQLGCHIQRVCSVRGVEGPRIARSTSCTELPEHTVTRQACAGPNGQLCNCWVHQPLRWSTLPSRLACYFLLCSQKHLWSLRPIHVPGVVNHVADELSHGALQGKR